MGAGLALPAPDYVQALYGRGCRRSGPQRVSGPGWCEPQLLSSPSSASEPPAPAGMWGWLSSPPEARSSTPSIRRPLQRVAASLESLTSLLSTAPGSGGWGWWRGGCTPGWLGCGGLQNQPGVSRSGNREIFPPPQASATCALVPGHLVQPILGMGRRGCLQG